MYARKGFVFLIILESFFAMKRILLLFALLLTMGASAFAQTKADALRLTLKAEAENPVEFLFTWKPVITYSADHKSMTLSGEGKEPVTFTLADVLNMTFFESEGKLEKIESVFADGKEAGQKGTYTLDGKRVEAITTPGTYIINGKKVLVK